MAIMCQIETSKWARAKQPHCDYAACADT